MKLIVGLGNPGREYDGTRHNVGFEVADRLEEMNDGAWNMDEDRMSRVARIYIEQETILLAKPETFMNKSGDAVLALATYYKLKPSDILIIHDDMDFEPGIIKLATKAGPAGHNGVADIQTKLKTDEIARIRIGIGRPEEKISSDIWVLTQPDDFDAEKIGEALGDAVSAAMNWIRR
ncbi:MAG: aminoacyl-tRNA hydrolase [bacterium]|nr:aminoacyl-tRNA hydrolase [bacterium]